MSLLSSLTQTGLVNFSLNAISFLISVPLKTEKLYDFTGTSAFIVSVVFAITKITPDFSWNSILNVHPRQLLVSVMTVTWATRLLVYLVLKVNLFGDRRFENVKNNPKKFAFFYTFQVVWVFLTSLPVYYVILKPSPIQSDLFTVWTDAVGFGMWAFGFFYECIADAQKMRWQISKQEKRFSEVLEVGLFKYSRYPQYFGEILLWSGMYVICGGTYPWNSYERYLLSISPIFVSWLIIKVSGVRFQDSEGNKRYKNNPRWKEYVSSTSLLVPWFPLRKSQLKQN
ncbi:hypothetical protein HK098_003806 [Nowakowskiella sp. JEL0407]|nr:hypothetical protein HK098_003806 [Nowakowskiella sp. JEL0407]